MAPEKTSIEHVYEQPNINHISAQRFFTREKVFNMVGNTVDFGVDATEFTLETAAYASGRLIRAIGRSAKSAFQGIMGDKYRHIS